MILVLDQIWQPARRIARNRDAQYAAGLVVASVLVMLVSFAFAHASGSAGVKRAMRIAAAASGGFSDDALRSANGEMDPAMLALARRYDPSHLRGAPDGQGAFQPAPGGPGQALLPVTPEKAAAINAEMPFSLAPNPGARPFSLGKGAEIDRVRAIECMTTAIYYEAAFEPVEGQRAVAQVVINRMRHPAFPKSICGVVFQGADLKTGCQFSFTCDGTLARPPVPWAWARAAEVARAALSGYVMKSVGGATHYHADYVAPYWAPRLYKVYKVGAHIFYRWPGDWGLPVAFNGRYAGAEAPGVDPGGDPNRVSPATLKLAGLEGAADAAQKAGRNDAAFTLASAAPIAQASTVVAASPEIVEAPAHEDKPVSMPVIEINRRPAHPPRLAMPD